MVEENEAQRSYKRVRRRSSFTFEGDLPLMSRGDAGKLPAVAKFVQQLKSLEVDIGETASFECKIRGNPTPEVTWFKDGKELMVPTDKIWTEAYRDGKHALVVKSVSLRDEGSYRCTAINKLGRDSSVGVLRLSQNKQEKPPSPVTEELDVCDVTNGRVDRSPDFIATPDPVVAEKGETVNFECQVLSHPAANVEFYKGPDKLFSNDRLAISESAGKCSLQILDISPTDEGIYRCVATNNIGKSSCSFLLTYIGEDYITKMSRDRPPSFSQTLQTLQVRLGERARLECRVEGRPKPSVMWNKDGKILNPSSRIRVMEICGNHSLVIPRTELYDSGVYSLTVTNRLGSDTTNSQLQVLDTSNGNRTNSKASNLTSPVTSRLVTGNASYLSPTMRSSNRSGGGGAPRKRGPGFILRPRPQTVSAGERLCLKCTLLGHPKPTVTWEKNGDLVDDEKTEGHIRTRIEGNDYFLEIEEAESSDAGKYTVTARNSLGKQTASVEVTVAGSNGSVSKTAPKTVNSVTSTLPSSNGTAVKHNDVISHKQQSSLGSVNSEDERRTPRVPELYNQNNAKAEESRASPTSSISSTMSSHSQLSASSNTSRPEADDHGDYSYSRGGRRKRSLVAPAFTRRLSSTQVLEGEELLLLCEVSGDPDPRLSWKRNEKEVGIDEDEVFTSFRDGVARLRMRDVQPQHAGEYVCVAKNEAGSVQCSSRVTVKAKRVTKRPRFIKSPADVRATEGETLTLEAEIEGQPTPEIVWSLDGEEISNGDASYSNNIARLVLHNVTPVSSGQYMCNALNSSGEDSVACRVRIRGKKSDIPPQFTAPLSDVTADEGSDVCLRCMVTGIPEPKVQWMCEDEELEAGNGTGISFQDGVAALTLEQTTEEDSGRYTCVAVNGEGRTTTECVVTVKPASKPEKKSSPSSPPKFLAKFDEYIRTQEGDTLELKCEVTGNPTPDVTWLLNDKKVENSEVTIENGVVNIKISPINSDHGGHIKCALSNQSGKASHEARIYVRSKRIAPTFETVLPSSITLHEGEEAYFECKVTGHPQPRVSWTRDGRSLSVLSTETLYENGVAAVRIRKAGPREAGKYVCVARNLSGEAESVCMVKFVATANQSSKASNQAPKFSTNLRDVTLQDGQDLHLECKVDGVPRPQVSWELDGHKIDSDEGDIKYENGVASLILEDAMTEDTGNYSCIATNSAGEARSTCHVAVQEAKKIEPVKPLSVRSEPSFPIVLDDVTIKEGDDIVLKCQVVGSPRPTIKWLVDGDEITDAEIKYTESGDVELCLTDSVPDDEGVYTCIAENPLKRVMSSCRVSIDALPRKKKSGGAGRKLAEVNKAETNNSAASQADAKPVFIQPLEDCIVPDASQNFVLSCRVSGNPITKWFHNDDEIEENEDFQFSVEGELRKLIFAEVFPDDSGTYTCLARNDAGEARSSCLITIQEIEGDPPTFLLKPKPVTVSVGGRASFSCRVDGDPAPTVQWMFCNQPIRSLDRIRLIDADDDNNQTHTLEIPQVCVQDAGRYSVCCRNLLGDIICTVSLIVDDAKRQEEQKDFRGVLKKSPVKTASKTVSEEKADFRSVLKKTPDDAKRSVSSGSEEEAAEPGIAYKESLKKPVKTKALTEEERKAQRAEQIDFRSNLVRKVDPKVVTQDSLRTQASDQVDFREEVLKTKVKTKAIGQDDLKTMHPEQKDFRSETIKSKVKTKAYREEELKVKRPEQKDFRDVLSPVKRDAEAQQAKEEEGAVKISEIPRSKWKKDVDHTIVSTKRARNRGAPVSEKVAPQDREEEEESDPEEEPSQSKPEFVEGLEDVTIKDRDPFELKCRVTGNPRPEIKWYVDDDVLEPEEDIITIDYKDDICQLKVAESLPDDQGKYTCTASNPHGESSTTCYVTVLGDGSSSSSPILSPKIPAKITNGPSDCVIRKGSRIHLACDFEGTSPLKVVWRKGKNEIQPTRSCKIATSSNASELKMEESGRDDSGCYTLQISNTAGVDQYSINVHVVDIPDSPGKPYTEMRPGKGVVVSWYGCAYDGGSSVVEYRLEMLKTSGSKAKSRLRWAEVTCCNSTSHAVEKVEQNAEYQFRVSAKNECGWSKPGPPSDTVRYQEATTNGVESTDDEDDDEFIKYELVELKKNIKFSSKYEIREKLGQGRFGKVHRVVHRQTGQQFAAKIMRALKAKDKEAVALEIDIMNQLRHPKLVQLIEAYQHEREVTMVMDLVAGGELFERVIDDDFELTEAACIKYMRQICHGVKFMHDSSVVHLDLKPENIMCVDRTGTRVKLIDFGLARKFNPKETVRVMFGTPEFVAPEVINYDAIGFQTDMWSVGVICYILLSGLSPFSGDVDSETLSNVTAATWDFDDEAFEQISDDAKDFISRLLVKNLKRRYTVDQAINHEWLKKNTTKMKKSKLDTKNLRRFMAKRKWQKTGNAVRALGRLASLAKITPSSSKKGGGQSESGFLVSLRAELEREKEVERRLSEKHKPEFIETFGRVEAIVGTAAMFHCVLSGNPDPIVTWYRDGKLLKPTRRFRPSYTEEGASLLIRDVCESDEGEYRCTAANSEGEITHSAELTVINM